MVKSAARSSESTFSSVSTHLHLLSSGSDNNKVNGFYGKFKVNLDPKGRISLPSKIRPKNDGGLSESMMLTQGIDGCLTLYTTEEWLKFEKRLDELSVTNRDFRFVSRFICSSASHVEPDKQGRFLIPSSLLEAADITRDALVIGAYRWIEIWNPERYKQFLDQNADELSDVADRLFAKGGSESSSDTGAGPTSGTGGMGSG